jgi:predicted nucleic acid-binding protein
MSADVYPDSSFLVSLYRHDGNYAAAAAFMQKRTPFLIFTPLHRVELRNALRLAEAQGFVTADERRKAFKEIEQDMRDGFLEHVAIAWSYICRRADELSEKYIVKHGLRTIDLLHVAAALESGAKLFLSFDQRQRGLAKAAALQVKP